MLITKSRHTNFPFCQLFVPNFEPKQRFFFYSFLSVIILCATLWENYVLLMNKSLLTFNLCHYLKFQNKWFVHSDVLRRGRRLTKRQRMSQCFDCHFYD
jgi:hypothetical protein